MQILIRVIPALLLGVAAAVLVSCGSTGAGLIPAASAGPLQNDFEAVAQAAQSGDGSCAATESALGKTEQDFLALPATVDKGLRGRLDVGIANLRKRALAMCAQPAPGTTVTETTATTTTTPPPASTETQTTPTTTTPTTPPSTETTPTATTPSDQSGGTAPGEGPSEGGAGQEGALGAKEEAGVGGASPGGGQ